MKILFTAFNGKYNSSKILLDNIETNQDKLYFRNSFTMSVQQLKKTLINNDYDLVISFGQSELEMNNIKIEIVGKNNDNEIKTNYDFDNLRTILQKRYNVEVSNDAGNYLCNHIYYNGLKYIKDNNLKCKMIFIHIPMLNQIENIKEMANLFCY